MERGGGVGGSVCLCDFFQKERETQHLSIGCHSGDKEGGKERGRAVKDGWRGRTMQLPLLQREGCH